MKLRKNYGTVGEVIGDLNGLIGSTILQIQYIYLNLLQIRNHPTFMKDSVPTE